MAPQQFPYFSKDRLEADCLGEFGKAVGFGSVGWWSGMAFRRMYGDILKGGAIYGGLFGIFHGTQCLSAHLRHSDDIYNAPIAGAITGAIMGARGGTGPRIAFCSAAFAFGALALEKIQKEYERVMPMTREERKKDRSDGFYKIQHDPYADRWAKIQAREASQDDA
ncbi:hypothetical protein BC829DRAFT_386515 [Chytridium lagenaria]|nr:hypothetical protein BC829DRAFT_386515 [Chytridium lagenaria]